MSVSTKICKTCHVEKPRTEFWKNARYADQKEPECIACRKIYLSTRKDAQKESQRKWREAHPDYNRLYLQTEKSKEYHRQYYRENADTYKARKKQWRAEHPDQEVTTRRAYTEANREKLNAYQRQWKAKKAESDPQFSLKSNVSRRIRYELHTLNKGRKTKRTTDYIGCSIEELKVHLERQFTPEMTWESYGSVWHIDHRIPCSAWNLTDEFESRCCWNYRNLQPMLASDNYRKKDRYDPAEKLAYMERMQIE